MENSLIHLRLEKFKINEKFIQKELKKNKKKLKSKSKYYIHYHEPEKFSKSKTIENSIKNGKFTIKYPT